MSLVKTDDITRAVHMHGIGGEVIAKLLMQALRFNKINKVYNELEGKSGMEFIDSVLNTLEIKYELFKEELSRIPAKGPFVIVSNHPFGGIDGILLIKVISEIRPDFKLLPNFILRKIDPMKEFFLDSNPFETGKNPGERITGLKAALKHIEAGMPIGVFPAGEVSTYYSDNENICDREWQYPVLNLIRKMEVPVIPVYFQGNNSRLFHILGRIHPVLKSAKLPSELLNKKNKLIKIRIGNPIPVKDQKELGDISRYGRYIRAKTYLLGNPLEVKKIFRRPHKMAKQVEQIIPPVDTDILIKEIKYISGKYLLFNNESFKVLCAPSYEMPNLLTEIGRLREITFRAIGEGTNRGSDLDEYDLYYYQLIIWDDKKNKIVGAYRIGKGRDIFSTYGIKGFYIQSLFRISRKFHSVINESIELGRSFVVEEYQKQPMSLFLLWKGILYFILKNPAYRYLIGPVSISNEFSQFSKDLIVDFIKKNFYNYEYARYIRPRMEFVVESDMEVVKDIFMDSNKNDLNHLDKIIKDIEPKYSMPVLLKRYLKLNARIIGFNIDPKFNDALDGLLILDIYDVPMSVFESLSKELNDDSLMDRFSH